MVRPSRYRRTEWGALVSGDRGGEGIRAGGGKLAPPPTTLHPARTESRRKLLTPHLLPPLGLLRRIGVAIGPAAAHPAADRGEVPTRERGQRLGLLRPALHNRATIRVVPLAGGLSLPGVAQHVARLEVGLIGRLLEDEILGEVLGVVAHVEPRDEGVLRATLQPEDPQALELLGIQGIRGAGIAPAHVPCVF